MINETPIISKEEIIEFILSGEKLDKNTNDLNLIGRVGAELYKKNRDFIKEKIKDNWFIIIEPVSGTIIASADQLKLYQYAESKFPDRLFYSVGLLKNNLSYYAR